MIGYGRAHVRLGLTRGACVDCGGAGQEWSLRKDTPPERVLVGDSGCDKGKPYSVHPQDYEARCTRCHRLYDGNIPRCDRSKKARGERHALAKLTAAKVVEIRERYAAGGISIGALAREHSVSHPTIKRVLRREAWGHVA